MPTCLVDVLNSNGNVIHTFPITLGEDGDAPDEAACKIKALEAAANAGLVPNSELQGLTARIHNSRGGKMEPFGDNLEVSAETKAGLEQIVRENAYFLWERDGCPDGKADEYWRLAFEQQCRERAYLLWQQRGCLEGQAEEDWRQVTKFQEQ